MQALEIKEWAATYGERMEAVETARLREIASLTDERALEIIKTLKPFGEVPENPLNGLGLVEQQAIFHRKGKG